MQYYPLLIEYFSILVAVSRGTGALIEFEHIKVVLCSYSSDLYLTILDLFRVSRSNFSLLTMPLPLVDAAAVLNPETEALMQRVRQHMCAAIGL